VLSPQSLARMSLLQRLLVWAVGVFFVGLVGYVVFYVPVRDELNTARNALARAEAIRRGLDEELAADAALADALSREEQEVAAKIAATAGASGPPEDLLFVLPELARLAGVQIERWSPQAEEAVGSWGFRRPVRVHVRATQAGLLEFLRRISELAETVTVDELSLVREGEAMMEISLRASAVWVRSDLAQQAERAEGGP